MLGVRWAAPFLPLSVSTEVIWKCVSALPPPSKESGISAHQKPSDGGCCTPRDTYHSSPAAGHMLDGSSVSLTQACMKFQTCPQRHRGHRVFPGSESRLTRTATCVFTWSTFRHVHKWTILSCLLGTKRPLNAAGTCLPLQLRIKPSNLLQCPFAHF